MGAEEIAHQIRKKNISSCEAVTAFVERHAEVDDAVGSFADMFEEAAFAQAQEADRDIQRDEPHGPLHGVPVTVKANVDVKGHPTTHGVNLLANNVQTENSAVVRNLLRAGAILLGRCNTSEFALRLHTESEAYGATINPWKTNLTPGGSSGGSAAALITGQCPLSHGNDFGGSLRYPAQCCGIVTIRPTFGRVSNYNPSNFSNMPLAVQLMAVQGPMGRNVVDVKLGLSVLSGECKEDPTWVPARQLERERCRPLKVAVSYDPAMRGDVDTHTLDGLIKAADILEKNGCIVEQVDPPDIMRAFDLFMDIVMNEIRSSFGEAMGVLKGDALKALECLIEGKTAHSSDEFLDALKGRSGLMRKWSEFFGRYDLILGPVACRIPFEVGADARSPDATAKIFESLRLSVACNLLGLPALVLPIGVEDGLPQAVQLIGRWHGESSCFEAAAILEAACGSIAPIDPAGINLH